uniref:Nucleotide-diphospho-sugar transferase domain-containing protein n=1 Tax=Setaria viridis TaxID=4556 RepID=A0A4V6D1C6_SETVI|nr:hypothetical protein SEVIR_9G273400v2 [Setaria viridis]
MGRASMGKAKAGLGRSRLMYSMRDILGFLAVAAVTTIAIVLLLPPPCPCSVMSSQHAEPLPLGCRFFFITWGQGDKLPELLRRAAMDDKTIIMTFTNEASEDGAPAEAPRHRRRGRQGIRAVPAGAPAVLRPPRGGHQLHVGAGVHDQGLLNMMWRRNRFQSRILELGYSFIFTDVDIIWLRKPAAAHPGGRRHRHVQRQVPRRQPYDLDKPANGGFVYAKAAPRTVAFYGGWYAARTVYPGNHEQFVFDQVKHALSARHDVRVQFVDTAYLSGFCELSKDFNKACTVHANCLVGLKDKLAKLAGVLNEWKQFRATAALTD